MDSKASTSHPADENSFDKPGPSGVVLAKKGTRRSQSQISCSTCCPACGVTIKLSDAAAHFELEVARLEDVSNNRNGKRARSHADRQCVEAVREERRKILRSVRQNRSKRLTLRTAPAHRRRRLPGQVDCPVCSQMINHLSETERIRHVDECLVSQNTSSNEVDIEGGSSESELEEYEWAGQTRIRSVILAEIMPRSNRNGLEDDIGDLDVDGVDEVVYGDPQFSEADLIPISEDNSSQRIREAMVRTAVANNGAPSEVPSKWDTLEDLSSTERLQDEDRGASDTAASKSASSVVIEALKSRIRDLEDTAPSQSGTAARCLVCLQSYLNPVVSTACWHVYCQDCWLKTLSCKKLCPQCSTITCPGDLRRIYL